MNLISLYVLKEDECCKTENWEHLLLWKFYVIYYQWVVKYLKSYIIYFVVIKVLNLKFFMKDIKIKDVHFL